MDKKHLMTFRRAAPQDAAGMAHVHITSWQETYTGLMPDAVMAELPLRFKSRYELWQTVTARTDQDTFVAEHPDYGIVGIMNGGAARDAEFAGQCEIYCLYLLKAFHRQGIGFRLLQDFFAASHERGYQGAYAWVLKGNPAVAFYQRTGAVLSDHEKQEEFSGTKISELHLTWPFSSDQFRP